MPRGRKRKQKVKQIPAINLSDDYDNNNTRADNEWTKIDSKHLQHVRRTGARTRYAKKLVPIAPAQDAVMCTTELLENILSHLPCAGLFSSQRVCSNWQDVIAKSSIIRRKMWLDIGELSFAGSENSDPSDYVKMFDKFALRANSKEEFPELMNLCLNPLLRAYDGTHAGTVRFKLRIGPATKRLEMLFFNEIMQSNTNGTWRGMYMTDPPVEAVEVDATWRVKGDISHGARVSHLLVTKPGGVTLSSLYEAIVDARGPVHTWIRRDGRMIQGTTLREVVRLVIERESERTGLDQQDIGGNSDCFFRFVAKATEA